MTKPGTGLTYIRGALGSPICVAMTVFVGCVGLGYAGIVGALLAMLFATAVGASAARYKLVQRHLDRSAELRDRSRRESARFKALRPAGVVRQTQYVELRDLVEGVEHDDSREAARFELQDLLNHFVEVSVAHQRCLAALRLAGGELPVAVPMIDAPKSKRRREIQARRIRHRDECLRRIERLGEEIEATDELIRLVAQRVACPPLHDDLDREIERRLWELDEVDAAIEQLSA
ncbi:hypothetical protein BH11MYX3_BH11MYX3_10430 [soil metagenome]